MIIDEYINGLTLPASFNTGIIADYKWENNCNDSSGNGYNATPGGAMTYTELDNAVFTYAINPTNTGYGVGFPAQVKITENITYLFFLKPAEIAYAFIIGNIASPHGIYLRLGDTLPQKTFGFRCTNTAENSIAINNNDINIWYPVIISIDTTNGLMSVAVSQRFFSVVIPKTSIVYGDTAGRDLWRSNASQQTQLGRFKIYNKAFSLKDIESAARYYTNLLRG